MDERELAPSSSQEVAEAEGFGKLYPSTQALQQQEEDSDDDDDVPKDVISRKELEKGRLSRDGKQDLFKQHGGSVVSTEFSCILHFLCGCTVRASIYSHPKDMDVSSNDRLALLFCVFVRGNITPFQQVAVV